VDKTASPNYILLGQYRERCENTNSCCGYHILSCGYCRAWLPAGKVDIQCASCH